MPVSRSEAYLLQLAERTFLKPWALAGPSYKAGKEITDLVIPFGDDVIIVSDKACAFDINDGLELAWARWSRAAAAESVKQLGGALRRLEMPQARVFADAGAREPLSFPLPAPDRRRYHLVAVARPSQDPTHVPEGWEGLRYCDAPATAPFTMGPLFVRGRFVHVFDGATIDFLLERLDTAPDFIEYLTSREAALAHHRGFAFREVDLLAHATINWTQGRGYRVDGAGPLLSRRLPGLWASYERSERAKATAEKDKPSRFIDELIEAFHEEHRIAMAVPGGHPDAGNHETAMRTLAQESRFARRMIVESLRELLNEPNQASSWAKALASPSSERVRYVLMTFPSPPADVTQADADRWYMRELSNHILVAADVFGGNLIVGLGIGNRASPDRVRLLRILDTRDPHPELRRHAAELREAGVFAELVETRTVHVP